MASAQLSAGPLPALLHLLENLADDAWSQTLLPMLAADGSAGNVALTCSCMRTHVHGNVQQISFQAQHIQEASLMQLEAWTAALPQHFPKCVSVQLALPNDDSYAGVSGLLAALARLPKLHSLHLNISVVNPVGLEMLLSTMRHQMAGLVHLTITSTSWLSVAAAWQQLGAMTQLTHLEIDFPPCQEGLPLPLGTSTTAFQWCDIASLQGLTGLQHLTLIAAETCGRRPHLGVNFLAKLTALAELRIGVPFISGLCAVRNCTQLHSLWLHREWRKPGVPPDVLTSGSSSMQGTLSAQDYEAVSHLTKLTSLGLWWPSQDSAVPALYSALQHLPQLTVIAARQWTRDVLPVFASCLTRLSTVHGAWDVHQPQNDVTNSSAAAPTTAEMDPSCNVANSCPHVQHLCDVAGSVPFQAFPNISMCSLGGSISPSALASISQHCTQLQVLDTVHPPSGALSWFSLPAQAPCTVRVQALYQLFRMPHHLNSFAWSVYDDAEMAALVAVARMVPFVYITVPAGSALTPCGLMQLGRLHMFGLRLRLHGISLAPADARMLLSCLCGRACVEVYPATPQQADVFHNAALWLHAVQLDRPAIRIVDVD